MSDWRMQGNAQRRRTMSPSSHLGGAVAASNIPDPAEALAGMARIGNPRQPMGNDGFSFNAPSAAPERGTLMPKKGNAKGAVEPAAAPGQPGTHAYASYDRNGAHYGVVVNYMAQTSPEAGLTQANGRIVRSVAMKSAPNFYDGAAASTY